MILFYLTIALFVLYSMLVIYYWRAWQAIPLYEPSSFPASIHISVIIPARNEEKNIGALLSSLDNQEYNRNFFEVIVVDDHSTDQTASIVRQFPSVKLIQLRDNNINSYKKKAIETGITAAAGDLIVTTDADCVVAEKWLLTIASFKEDRKAKFVSAPVSINCNSSIVQVFQAMDFMVLQGITGAVAERRQMSMCNGANLAYERDVFYEVSGFSGIDQIASGDDMLLMYKIAQRHPHDLHYLKSPSAIVSTQPAITWKEFFQQRIRWASKAAKYQDKRILPVLALVYLFNLLFVLLLIGTFWNLDFGIWALVLLVAKTLVELPLFCSVAQFFNKPWAIRWFFFFQPLHIIYTIAAGLFGQFGKYEWKGRKVR